MGKPKQSDRVDPLPGIAPYFGGKVRLAKRLVGLIEAHPHTCYCEPFIGMGGVFFRRTRRTKSEIVNDLSYDVANLFRCAKRHHKALVDELSWMAASDAEFERLKRVSPDDLTDLERASRFLFLQYMTFGGKLIHRSRSLSTQHPARFSPRRVSKILGYIAARLDGVTITQASYEECIAKVDRPHTMFYLDPPYWGREREYLARFGKLQFQDLATLLAEARGTFIMSINDTPEVREVLGRFAMATVDLSYSVQNRCIGKRYRELVVSNQPDLIRELGVI